MRLSEMRKVARDALGDRGRVAWIYWVDMVTSAALGWAGLALASWSSAPHLVLRLAGAVVSSFALYRAAYFVHEIAHFGKGPHGRVRGFVLGWHLLVGVPLMLPAFMATMHKDHHRRATYGTSRDPEYDRVASWSRAKIVGSVLVMAIVPPLLALRWAVVTPLSLLHPRLRRLTVRYLSTLAINPAYARPEPTRRDGVVMLAVEVVCATWVWSVVALVLLGVLPVAVPLWFWGVLAAALCLNQLKTLVTHAFELGSEDGVSIHGQLLDSITVGGGWSSELIAPLGNRYHAIHHVLPDVAYHDLGRVHRRWVALGSERSGGYEKTRRSGFVHAFSVLWAHAATGERRAERAVP